jgi:hypothetical protein
MGKSKLWLADVGLLGDICLMFKKTIPPLQRISGHIDYRKGRKRSAHSGLRDGVVAIGCFLRSQKRRALMLFTCAWRIVTLSQIPITFGADTMQNARRRILPDAELIRAVVEMKQRTPHWGCPRIAQQIALAFGILISKDVVRQIIAGHFQPTPSGTGLRGSYS